MKIIANLVLLVCGSVAIAAPNITGVSGTFQDGERITLSGSNFGSGPDVVVFDDFEGGQSGSLIALQANSVAPVGAWHSLGDDDACTPMPPRYTNQNVHGGSLAFLFDGTGSCWRNGLITAVNSNEIFFRYWIHVASNACLPEIGGCGSSNWKTNWLLGPSMSPVSGDRYPFVSDAGLHNRVGSNSAPSYYFGNFVFGKGMDMLWEYWGDPDPNDGMGDMTMRGIDGAAGATYETWVDRTNVDVQASGDWTGRYYYLDIGGYGSSTDLRAYIDDVYIAQGSNARARVVVADGSSLASSRNLTLCTTGASGDSWSNGSISCTMRGGSFNGGEVWLYVIDGNGNTSSAAGPYSFNETNTGGTTTNLPAPSNLRRDDTR